MDRTDEELMEMFAGGNAEAFDELYERYSRPLYRFIAARGGVSGEAAEEVLQEVFIKIMNAAQRFDTSRKFSSWLFRIADNTLRDALRRQKTADGHNRDAQDSFTASPGPEAIYENAERALFVQRLVLRLPPEQRDVLILREYAELSFKDIADVLDCPLNTALGRMHSALKKLKQMMDEETQ